VPYDELLFTRPERLYVYGARAPGCPSVAKRA